LAAAKFRRLKQAYCSKKKTRPTGVGLERDEERENQSDDEADDKKKALYEAMNFLDFDERQEYVFY